MAKYTSKQYDPGRELIDGFDMAMIAGLNRAYRGKRPVVITGQI